MEQNKDKQLNDFVEKIVKTAGLETPSDQFTQSIMSKIKAQSVKSAVTNYKPLISKRSWLVLCSIAIFLLAYVFFGNSDLNISWLPSIDAIAMDNMGIIDALSNLRLPDTLLYGLTGLTLFIYVQIVFLKKHLERRFTIN
ncbi:hypothetical protein [Eudoraea adriatica]|uniref:hypothetical protein n=1 Tax=Eudoraea adriatica TaxID=446681 RepID=UPI000378D8FF|nr:hypothetical protein [Eudoraea adriatica]